MIFTNGAFIEAREVDGKFMWVVVEFGFGDDTFNDGYIFNPATVADTEEELLASGKDEEEVQ